MLPRLVFGVLLLLGAGSALAQDDVLSIARGLEATALHSIHAETLRQLAMGAATNVAAAGRFAPAAAEAWARMLAPASSTSPAKFRIPPSLVEDFFTGATFWMGPCDAQGAVFAYDNPFWDVVLFMRTAGGDIPLLPPDGTDVSDKPRPDALSELLDGEEKPSSHAPEHPSSASFRRVPVVEEFAWLDGDAFRGEPLDSKADDSFPVRIWRTDVAGEKRFAELFPDAPMSLSPLVRFPKSVVSAEADAMLGRAARRAAALAPFATDRSAAALAAACAAALRAEDEAALAKRFDDAAHRAFVRQWARLPAEARRGIVPYGAARVADGLRLLFVNRDMPRLYATVFFPASRLDGSSRAPVAFEWYDVGHSGALLDAVRQQETAP